MNPVEKSALPDLVTGNAPVLVYTMVVVNPEAIIRKVEHDHCSVDPVPEIVQDEATVLAIVLPVPSEN